jgi:hypothetical protein
MVQCISVSFQAQGITDSNKKTTFNYEHNLHHFFNPSGWVLLSSNSKPLSCLKFLKHLYIGCDVVSIKGKFNIIYAPQFLEVSLKIS